jgi:hypothetical protein
MMQESAIIRELRELAKRLEQHYLNEDLIAPTGHRFHVGKDDFRIAFSLLLQAYELTLISRSSIMTLEEYKDAHLVSHFHDGNVIILPKESAGAFLDDLQKNLAAVCKDLGLASTLSIESTTYPRQEDPNNVTA